MSQRQDTKPVTDLRSAFEASGALVVVATRVAAVLEQAVAAQDLLTSHERRVQELEHHAQQLTDQVKALQRQEADATARQRGAEDAARVEVARATQGRDATLAELAQGLARAQRQHAEQLAGLTASFTARKQALDGEIADLEARAERARTDVARIKAGL
jgi:DNA repair exonuclease SbcCD ATPase subunit